MKQEVKGLARFLSWGKLCYQKCLVFSNGHYKSKRKEIQNKAGKDLRSLSD